MNNRNFRRTRYWVARDLDYAGKVCVSSHPMQLVGKRWTRKDSIGLSRFPPKYFLKRWGVEIEKGEIFLFTTHELTIYRRKYGKKKV